MQNLTGNPQCEDYIRLELTAAKIPIVTGPLDRGDVPSTLRGRLRGITFERAWVYWVAKGRVPIDIAREIYADPVGRADVRVDGYGYGRDPDCKERYGKPCDSYHIDSQEGLLLFADAIRDLPEPPPPPPTIEELRHENARLKALLDHDFAVTRLHYEEGAPLELEAEGAPIVMFAAVCRQFLADAKNYVELSLRDDLGKLSVVVQRTEGETPAQKAARLQKRLDAIEALDTPWPLHEVLRQLAEAADHLLGDHDCDGQGYESIQYARDVAKVMVKALTEGP